MRGLPRSVVLRSPTRNPTGRRRLLGRGTGPAVGGLIGVAVVAGLQPSLWGGIGGLLDYYPVYHGAQAWLATADAYWRDPALADLGQVSAVGNAYPIHAALLLGLPLSFLPAGLAGPIWVLLVGGAWVAAIAWARESWYWLLWWPMWDALRIQQLSAAVTVASIVALGSIRRESRTAFLVAVAVMSVKPQQSFVLVLAFVWLGRQWWRAMVTAWGGLLLIAFLAQPGWVTAWIDQVRLRSEVVQGERWLAVGLIPLGVFLLHRKWWGSGMAVLSSALGPWPVSGPYAASVWPLGVTHRQGSAVVLVGLLGLVPLLLNASYWFFPAILVVGLAVSAALLPGPGDRGPIGPPHAVGGNRDQAAQP